MELQLSKHLKNENNGTGARSLAGKVLPKWN